MLDAGQQKHSDFIKFTRNLAEFVGRPVSQIRRVLRETLDDHTKKQNPDGAEKKEAPAPTPFLNPRTMGFEAKQFQSPGGGGASAPPAGSEDINDLIIIINGTGYEDCVLKGTLGTPI